MLVERGACAWHDAIRRGARLTAANKNPGMNAGAVMPLGTSASDDQSMVIKLCRLMRRMGPVARVCNRVQRRFHPHQCGARVILPFTNKALLVRLEVRDPLPDLLAVQLQVSLHRLQFDGLIKSQLRAFGHRGCDLLRVATFYKGRTRGVTSQFFSRLF